MKIDLHLHTTYSDGSYTPSQTVDMAVKKGLNGIAITDHDSIEGIDEAINRGKLYNDFYVIPGIEFSCTFLEEEVHLLGYFFNYKSPKITNLTTNLRKARVERGIKIIEKLNELDVKIDIEDVLKYTDKNYIGRPHIGKALVDNKYVSTIDEAFSKYLEKGKPGYVKRYKLKIDEVIKLIHDEKGLVSLAHPGLIDNKEIINYCIEAGIDGIEVIHPKHTDEDISRFSSLADKYNLIKTGGSDWHGDMKAEDSSIGKYYVNLNNIPEMKGRL